MEFLAKREAHESEQRKARADAEMTGVTFRPRVIPYDAPHLQENRRTLAEIASQGAGRARKQAEAAHRASTGVWPDLDAPFPRGPLATRKSQSAVAKTQAAARTDGCQGAHTAPSDSKHQLRQHNCPVFNPAEYSRKRQEKIRRGRELRLQHRGIG